MVSIRKSNQPTNQPTNQPMKNLKCMVQKHCSRCRKKLKIGKRKGNRKVLRVDLNVNSVLDDMMSSGREFYVRHTVTLTSNQSIFTSGTRPIEQ